MLQTWFREVLWKIREHKFILFFKTYIVSIGRMIYTSYRTEVHYHNLIFLQTCSLPARSCHGNSQQNKVILIFFSFPMHMAACQVSTTTNLIHSNETVRLGVAECIQYSMYLQFAHIDSGADRDLELNISSTKVKDFWRAQ